MLVGLLVWVIEFKIRERKKQMIAQMCKSTTPLFNGEK
jgi:hypothetical protein